MIFWLLIIGFLLLAAVGATLAITHGSHSNFFGWGPDPLGCLMVIVAILGMGGMGLFYLGMRAAS